ncbi:putative F-box domain-containing protein [Lupinus albus]|uniref:Putative F-box domain-containing protein n=1 Tax=Lupinus albus TaxID=3870 RepID=A0A6A4QU47_LUPAL|nr:putative F-box domain-containing protein [Lupinus albus]
MPSSLSNYIPEVIVEQILLHLPSTTLVRFTSVSKSWLSLISSLSFTLQRSFSNPKNPSLLLIHRSQPFSPSTTFTTTPPPYSTPHPFSLRFIGSLYGVVCFIEQSIGHDHAITLFNPSIRSYLRLQTPAVKHTALGFGFDSYNTDFKLIRIFNRVELYSLNQGFWRCIHCPYRKLQELQFSNTQCFLHGNVHWVVSHSYVTNSFVLIFNMEQEKFKKMSFPPNLVLDALCTLQLKVTVIEGYLSVLDCCGIWMMREYGVAESWTKMFNLDLERGCISKVFGFRSSAIVLMLLHKKGEISLHSFDTKTQEIKDLRIKGEIIAACEDIGSLVLLDRISCPVSKSQDKRRR